jgi:hypothetical protein
LPHQARWRETIPARMHDARDSKTRSRGVQLSSITGPGRRKVPRKERLPLLHPPEARPLGYAQPLYPRGSGLASTLRPLSQLFVALQQRANDTLPPRGLPPTKPFPKPIRTPPKPDNTPRKPCFEFSMLTEASGCTLISAERELAPLAFRNTGLSHAAKVLG